MKKAFFTTICIMVFAGVMAQAPQGISHQAVMRNAAGELITNTPVGIQVSILQGSAEGTVVYSETHTPQSNANGLITFVIGQGADQSSDFSAIDWADGLFFVKTEADPEGGTNYTIEGVSQLWSVPYALSAGTTGAGIAAGDSLVLKDEEGMTRFVLNPNTGMLKMMHNDTVWYSIEVKSPHVITHLNDDGSMTVSKGNGYEIYVFDDQEKSKNNPSRIEKYSETRERDSFSSTKQEFDSSTGVKIFERKTESNLIRDDEGNYVTTERTVTETANLSDGQQFLKIIEFSDEKGGFKYTYVHSYGSLISIDKKYKDGDGNEILERECFRGGTVKKIKQVRNSRGMLLSEETFEDDIKQSETTYTSSIVPEMGLTTNTRIEKLFDAQDELVQETTQTSQTKDTPEEKYKSESIEAISYINGVFVASYKQTDKKNFNADGSVTQTTTNITQAENINSVLQQVKHNGTLTSEKRFQNPPGFTGVTMREFIEYVYDDNTSQKISSFHNPFGGQVFSKTETADRTNNSITTEVSKQGQGSSSIKQDNNEIEFQANQVVSVGDHYVTGAFGVVGDFGAFVSNDFDVFGNLNVEGTKNFRINHPADSNKYLFHAAIESNEVLNQYSGNVTTGADGLATVTLPDYFHLINIDFRYQLTIIGTSFARAVIFSEIDENNQFVIKTDEPNTKVSWQVTAKRNDQRMIDNPFLDVVDK